MIDTIAENEAGLELVATEEQRKLVKAIYDHAGRTLAGRILTETGIKKPDKVEYQVTQLSAQYHKSTKESAKTGSFTASLFVRLNVKTPELSSSIANLDQVSNLDLLPAALSAMLMP